MGHGQDKVGTESWKYGVGRSDQSSYFVNIAIMKIYMTLPR
ncbi:hypothetical protein COLO4_18194 [Corchorus olitorius]|uniref:Uncharacterized protein n=1 Tax=Corchorus olitorius TaxID=93759 RepID=A0A1R3JA25_9ROSI|nr:hypothetical protein COLO4_18194 [Corchorus olitorius]